MKQFSPAITLGLLIAFLAGLVSHLLYQRWNPSFPPNRRESSGKILSSVLALSRQAFA